LKIADDPKSRFPKAHSAAVEITLRDGRRLARREDVNRSHAERPLSHQDIQEKFLLNMRSVADDETTQRVKKSVASRCARGGRRCTPCWPLRCEICQRKMQGAVIRKGIYYRCIARTLAPGSPVFADHPKTVNLREDVVMPALHGWLCRVFGPDNVDETVTALVGSQEAQPGIGREVVAKRLADAEARLRRHQAAIEAGVDPAAVVEAINAAQAERAAARAELEHRPAAATFGRAEVYAMLDSLGDVPRALNLRRPERVAQVYRDLRLRDRRCDGLSPCG
jgi:hypothetical protein